MAPHGRILRNLSNVWDSPAEQPCSVCASIVPDHTQNLPGDRSTTFQTPYTRLDIYPDFTNLKISAEAGCSLCGLIRERFRAAIPPHALRSVEESKGSLVWMSDERARQILGSWDQKVRIKAAFDYFPRLPVRPVAIERVSELPRQLSGAVTSLEFSYSPFSGRLDTEDHRFPWSGLHVDMPVFDSSDFPGRRLPSKSSLSIENIRLMQGWIRDCTANHTACSATSRPWIPARLLRIDLVQGALQIKLLETCNTTVSAHSSFAALSHMWGDMKTSPPLRLTKANKTQLQQSICESDMPRNFLDAARVCSSLGIRYLWIDSLCIIQDSADDWKVQSGQMHLVYRYAVVTIVATSATSCRDGFLARDTETVPAIKISYRSGQRNGGDSGFRGSYIIISGHPQPRETHRMFAVNASEWNTRGWTMQERSLSTRMIHFCRNKIFFECRGNLTSEENEPTQEPDLTSSILWPREHAPAFSELYQHWQLYVCEYGTRNLTFSKDKLPAIQSIAEEIIDATQQTYIRFAGMWLHNLREELLWCAILRAPSPTPEWRAPSWSWASVEGQISLWNQAFRDATVSPPGSLLARLCRCQFEVIGTDQDSPDPNSDSRGYLKVRTLVKHIRCMVRHETAARKRPFFPYDLVAADTRHSHDDRKPQSVVAYGHVDFDDPDAQHEHGVLVYMHVNDHARATGLILRGQSEDGTLDPRSVRLWRRIGIATLFEDRSAKAIMEDVFDDTDRPVEVMLI